MVDEFSTLSFGVGAALNQAFYAILSQDRVESLARNRLAIEPQDVHKLFFHGSHEL